MLTTGAGMLLISAPVLAATARARDGDSLLPARYFVEHWFTA